MTQSNVQGGQRQKDENTVEVKVVLKFEDYSQQEFDIKIHKSREVSDLYSRTQTWLQEKFNMDPDNGNYKFSLRYRNQLLDKNVSLIVAGITDDSKVFVQIAD